MNLDQTLEKLSEHLSQRILNRAADDVITVAEETAAFKALQSYYAMKHKLPESKDEKGGFAGHANTIRGLGNSSDDAEADF